MQSQLEYARQLYDRIRRECKSLLPSLQARDYNHHIPNTLTNQNLPVPELRIYRFWEKPVGPHPYAMFEVNLFTPAQFGAFIPWLVIWRGPLSALVHPNTVAGEGTLESEEELRNHTQRATWLGDKVPLDLSMFYAWRRKEIGEGGEGVNGGV